MFDCLICENCGRLYPLELLFLETECGSGLECEEEGCHCQLVPARLLFLAQGDGADEPVIAS
jgi:hypothetical protein